MFYASHGLLYILSFGRLGQFHPVYIVQKAINVRTDIAEKLRILTSVHYYRHSEL